MEQDKIISVINQLLKIETLDRDVVDKIIKDLESCGCKWRNLGDLEANYARIHIVGSGSQTLIERLTNAIDATLEKFAQTKTEVFLNKFVIFY